jgi:hypothetical protein
VRDHQLQRVRRSLLYRETKTEASDAWLPMPDIVAAALKTRRAQLDGEREAACEIWQQMNGIPSLIFTGRTAPHRSPHPQQEARGALRPLPKWASSMDSPKAVCLNWSDRLASPYGIRG